MSDFRLSCFQLFQNYPLVNYREATEGGRYRLNILLVGSGARMDTLFQQILVNGQLLDTDLHVTILTANGSRAAKACLTKYPELKRYAKVCSGQNPVNEPNSNYVYATIDYVTFPKTEEDLKELVSGYVKAGYRYAVVSTGKDEKNTEYAQILSAAEENPSLIGYVQNKEPKTAIAGEGEGDIYAFGYPCEASFTEELEQLAYNIHYAYSKSVKERMANSEILSTFADPYNYLSSLEAAIHIQEKLECCGIDSKNSSRAAEEFNRRMANDSTIVDRLSALEHRRWMMSMIMRGFTIIPDTDLIYSGREITTHDKKAKWHCCLLPCNETSYLTLSHWKNPKANYGNQLDPLDRISLMIHNKCGEVAQNNREQIEEALTIIRNSVQRIFEDTRKEEHMMSCVHSMELAISQMWQNKKSAIAIYETNLRELLSAAAAMNTSSSYYLEQSLTALNEALSPLKEFISHKDYKEQDRILIRQIPFALTHKKQLHLVKLLAGKEADSLFSTCQLEPDQVTFITMITNHSEYLDRKEKLANILRFLAESYSSTQVKVHILLPVNVAAEEQEKLKALSPDCVQLHAMCEMEYLDVTEKVKEILSELEADYIDVTGSDPMLTLSIADQVKGIISYKSGQLINIKNAPEIAYPLPKRGITVKEMFELSGSVLVEESDSSRLSDLSHHYKVFYNIVAKRKYMWEMFCLYVRDVYKQERKYVSLPKQIVGGAPTGKNITLNANIAAAMMPMLNELEKNNVISELTVTSALAGQKTIAYKSCEFNGSINDVLHECAEQYTATTTYQYKKSKNAILCADLMIRNMVLPEQSAGEFSKILNELKMSKLIIDMVKNENGVSFQFASSDILAAIQNSGKVLEYYIYYTALLDAHFDDVEMGWHFSHTTEKGAADNELDIICTKGISSLFISAKHLSKKKLEDEANLLNYIVYEIALLADRFGINARPVLVMPEVEQFQVNAKTNAVEFSKEVKAAYKRGVYLVGKECVSDKVFGEVLDRIADGRDDWCDFLKPTTK